MRVRGPRTRLIFLPQARPSFPFRLYTTDSSSNNAVGKLVVEFLLECRYLQTNSVRSCTRLLNGILEMNISFETQVNYLVLSMGLTADLRYLNENAMKHFGMPQNPTLLVHAAW